MPSPRAADLVAKKEKERKKKSKRREERRKKEKKRQPGTGRTTIIAFEDNASGRDGGKEVPVQRAAFLDIILRSRYR